MSSIPFITSDYKRNVAQSAKVLMKNRYFEANPIQTPDNIAVIARPALKRFVDLGDNGPVRGVYSAPGAFDGAAFVISGTTLYKIESDETVTTIGECSTTGTGSAKFAAVANIGEEPEKLFFVDDGKLYVYLDNGYALGHLQAAGTISNGEQVVIDGVYYQFTTGSVDTGTPAGTSGSPWLINRAVSDADAMLALAKAITLSGEAGTDYSTATTSHPTVTVRAYNSTDLYIRALSPGAAGNSIATTETGTNLSWDAATLENGGNPGFSQVLLPEDVGAIDVATINSYVIVIPAQGEGINGRFYWVEPGESTIDTLDFATAERSPDAVQQVLIFSDLIWFLGESTTEAWRATGDDATPFARFTGVLFDRGAWEGTAVATKKGIMLVDQDAGVYLIRDGEQLVSTPQIEEQIRRAMEVE